MDIDAAAGFDLKILRYLLRFVIWSLQKYWKNVNFDFTMNLNFAFAFFNFFFYLKQNKCKFITHMSCIFVENLIII